MLLEGPLLRLHIRLIVIQTIEIEELIVMKGVLV
jgi:hypothetical protein